MYIIFSLGNITFLTLLNQRRQSSPPHLNVRSDHASENGNAKKRRGEDVVCIRTQKVDPLFIAQPPPLDSPMSQTTVSSPLVLPEHDHDSINNHNIGFKFPRGRVSLHKKGIRNGPKALKPVPVIIRCKSCSRVKLLHFYCCSGDRGNTGEQNSSSS
ncbi:unnamed protein product [Camellia sinensis]